MTKDVKEICLWLVRGYQRRIQKRIRSPEEDARIKAIDQAKNSIGLDLFDEQLRQRLIYTILLNCESGRKYPYEILALDGISRMDFYRRKREFLFEVAKNMRLI